MSGQYFFNGESYEDSDRKTLIASARDIQASPPAGSDAGLLATSIKGLIYGSGRHYAGLSVSKTELWTEDLSVSLLAIANLSDLSGMVAPTVSYELFERMTLRAGATFYWATDLLWGAGDDGEYVVVAGGPAVTLSLGASLGGGRF